MMLYKTCLDRP